MLESVSLPSPIKWTLPSFHQKPSADLLKKRFFNKALYPRLSSGIVSRNVSHMLTVLLAPVWKMDTATPLSSDDPLRCQWKSCIRMDESHTLMPYAGDRCWEGREILKNCGSLQFDPTNKNSNNSKKGRDQAWTRSRKKASNLLNIWYGKSTHHRITQIHNFFKRWTAELVGHVLLICNHHIQLLANI